MKDFIDDFDYEKASELLVELRGLDGIQ